MEYTEFETKILLYKATVTSFSISEKEHARY
jgi:hypothetical protein